MNDQSLIHSAYTYLKEQIVSGNLVPGTLLSENELAEKLQMSRTPVRNAISHLEAEGFVVSLKKRGVLVKEISFKEMVDMFEATMSMLIYTLDVRKERGIRLNLDKLEECVQKQMEAEKADDYLTYCRYSMLFAKAVISTINNQAMIKAMDSYVDKIAMVAYNNYKNTPYKKHYSANDVNRALLNALKEDDDEEARRIAKNYIARSRMGIDSHF